MPAGRNQSRKRYEKHSWFACYAMIFTFFWIIERFSFFLGSPNIEARFCSEPSFIFLPDGVSPIFPLWKKYTAMGGQSLARFVVYFLRGKKYFPRIFMIIYGTTKEDTCAKKCSFGYNYELIICTFKLVCIVQ